MCQYHLPSAGFLHGVGESDFLTLGQINFSCLSDLLDCLKRLLLIRQGSNRGAGIEIQVVFNVPINRVIKIGGKSTDGPLYVPDGGVRKLSGRITFDHDITIKHGFGASRFGQVG